MSGDSIPGVLAVWTGSQPTSRAFRLSTGGLVFGRDQMGTTDDDRLLQEHARIERIENRFVVVPLSEHTRTYANGRSVDGRVEVEEQCVMRTGSTVSLLLADVRPYEHVPVARQVGLVSGAATTKLHSDLEAAAVARAHVVISGEGGSGRGHLARRYRNLLASPDDIFFDEDVSGPSADKVDARLAMLASSPSGRVVMTFNNLSKLHPRFEAWLRASATWFALPALRDRPDELSAIVHETIRARASSLVCHASLIEYCLMLSRDIGLLVSDLELTADAALQRGETALRAETLQAAVRSRRVVFPLT